LKSRKQGFRSALRELDKNRVPFRHEAVRHTFRLCRSQDGLDALRPASAVTRFGRNPLHLHGAAHSEHVAGGNQRTTGPEGPAALVSSEVRNHPPMPTGAGRLSLPRKGQGFD
jgi:hypothetical protein